MTCILFQKKLNARLVNSMNEVCMMSEKIISELIDGIIGQIATLYRVGEFKPRCCTRKLTDFGTLFDRSTC